jgi:ABC-type lipoprotein release transport system permease subunit
MPESFFPFNSSVVFYILLSVFLASFIASFLPARKAVGENPLETIIYK